MKRILCLILGWSLALAPLQQIPARAAAAEPVETPAAEIQKDLRALTDRAVFPNIPRRGKTGAPSASEVADLQRRLSGRQQDLTRMLNTELKTYADDALEISAFLDLQMFYDSAQKLEALKLLVGHKIDPTTWDPFYKITVGLDDLAQSKFVETASTAGELRLVTNDNERNAHFPMRTRLTTSPLKKTVLEFRLNPDFLEMAEQQALVNEPNTRNAVRFGIHFTIHRLYDSQFTIGQFTPGPAALTPVSASWRQRFASLEIKDQEIQLRARKIESSRQKLALLTALSEYEIDLKDKPATWSLDTSFWNILGPLIKQPALTVNQEAVRQNESLSFASSVRRLVDAWQPRDLSDWEHVLYLAKRLSLRWMILANPDFSGQLAPEGQHMIGLLLDARAKAFATEIMGWPKMRAALAAALQPDVDQRKTARKVLYEGLSKGSLKLRFFENQEVNLSYLIGMEKSSLDALKASSMIGATIEALGQQSNYKAGYQLYRLTLATVLEAYVLPIPFPKTNTIDELLKVKNKIRFNPEALRDSLPGVYIEALKANADQRAKDISDLLEIGRLLRFNVYEHLPEEPEADMGGVFYSKRPSPKNLKVGERWYSPMLGQNFGRYREEIKKDVFNSVPILGSTVHSGNPDKRAQETWELWEYLAANHLSTEKEQNLIDRQLSVTLGSVRTNIASLDQSVQKMDSSKDDSLQSINEEIRTIVARTAQLTFLLNRFVETSAYSQEIRRELLMPGYWEKEFEQLSNWTNSYVNYLMAFFVFQILGSRFNAIGKITDRIATYLAPVFGANFSRLQPLIWGLVGVSTAGFAYKGWGSEATRAEILKNYFSCGATGVCVAMYQDVSRQVEIRDSNRMQAVIQVALIGAIIGGFRLLSRFVGNRLHGMGAQSEAVINRDLSTLGIEAGTPISNSLLREKLASAVQLAKSQSDGRLAAIGEAYANQAHARLHQMAWQEAKRWNSFDQRFGSRLQKLGLNLRDAKNQQSLSEALGRIEAMQKSGALTQAEYLELKGDLLSIASTMNPIWQTMEANKTLAGFYNYVFDISSGKLRAEISGTYSYYSSTLNRQFIAAADDFMALQYARPRLINGRIESNAQNSRLLNASTRLERLMAQAGLELEKNPQSTGQILENLVRLASREIAK